MWASAATLGFSEGTVVQTVIPGSGMLLNCHPDQFNTIQGVVSIDHGGLERGTQGAGSSTHYHDLAFYSYRPIEAGSELLLNYGNLYDNSKLRDTSKNWNKMRSIDWLLDNGVCLDLLRPGPSLGKGRGAFATRLMAQGSGIAPLPVLPVSRESLEMQGVKGDSRHQLLLNYCIGHAKSSLLLFPYAPVVNLLNHGNTPNAELQWSTHFLDKENTLNLSATEIILSHRQGIVLELVALRDIEANEEVLIDYGEDWRAAWASHKANFDQSLHKSIVDYAYASVFNQDMAELRTVQMQKDHAYPSNLETACYYLLRDTTKTWLDTNSSESFGEWTKRSTTFNLASLRPCSVIDHTLDTNERSIYTVVVGNLFSESNPQEIIPTGERHVVTNMPRKAIRFVDRPYTTDQHLPNAFRNEIGLPKSMFPISWMNL